MRSMLLTLLALLLLVPHLGCLAFYTTHHVRGKTAIVIDDEVYVVDLKARTARKVTITQPEEIEDVEVIIIEESGSES